MHFSGCILDRMMKKGAAVPVRLDEEEKRQLSKIATETGLTPSTLIRLLISSLVVSYRNDGQRLTLPLSAHHLLAADGKAHPPKNA